MTRSSIRLGGGPGFLSFQGRREINGMEFSANAHLAAGFLSECVDSLNRERRDRAEQIREARTPK